MTTIDVATTRAPREAPGTIWYMGAKTRLLAELDAAIGPLLKSRRGGRAPVLVDLFAGTGVVGAHFADRARIVAADAQRYAATLARSLLVPAPADEAGLERILADTARRRKRIARRFAPQIAAERGFLEAEAPDLDRYRTFIERDVASHDPAREAPDGLCAAYYRNIYFGAAQAATLDALRLAIDDAPEPARTAYLAALLFAASRATSGTSHFAQPRGLSKPSELAAMLGRRRIDILDLFAARVRWLARVGAAAKHAGPNEAHAEPYERALARLEPGAVDVVYADPPYTSDNYSRFYHVLEVLVTYDAPPLARNGKGELLRGRYPEIERRFQSAFTSPETVEREFRRVTGLAADRGAAMVWSYARTNGLLLKLWAGDLERFQELLNERYRKVAIHQHGLHHSGSGDRNHASVELIAVCTGPKPGKGAGPGTGTKP